MALQKMNAVMRNIPNIEEKTKQELEEIIRIIMASSLPETVKSFIIKCIESALWFPHLLQKKNISLGRLREMIFGKHAYAKGNDKNNSNNASAPPHSTVGEMENIDTQTNDVSKDEASTGELTTTQAIENAVNALSKSKEKLEDKKKIPGHGRMPHTVYEEFKEILLKIVGLQAGDACPQQCGGTLYRFEPNKPRVLLRIKGQNFADIYKYIVEQLRCNVCAYLIRAEIPAEVGTEKYDASFKAWMVLQKYFVAVPFYRQETFQRMLNFPLPDSTQWDLVEQVAGFGYRIFNALTVYAANGQLIHNDDTRVRIQEVIQENKNNPDAKRTGMFTTGMVAEYEGYQIALFFNGTAHSGENMEALLKKRDLEKPPIIQMCDALTCNLAKEIKTIVCNCLSHGFRKFDELINYFPIPCITIMKLLSQVYENDALTKGRTPNERLSHHQIHSLPVMELLSRYLKALVDEKLVEPNSELGKSIKYMQKHWHKLTRFLSVAGAPLCNNITERALKIAIRNRKNAMFYRSRYSAHIGGMLTNIIYTCHLNEQNPHHYLTVLQEHPAEINKNPEKWLPWNYSASNSKECVHARDAPVVG